MCTPLVSIIIPAYNAEACILRCVESVIKLLEKENVYEIIIVNDGSLDNTSAILESLSKKNNSIHVINKVNEGVSVARNVGIQSASGDYLLFLDSDDELFSLSLVSILPVLRNQRPDLVFSNMVSTNVDGETSFRRPSLVPHRIYTGEEAFNNNYLRVNAGGAICRREFLLENNLLFPSGVSIAEDTIFFAHCQALSRSLIYIDVDLYHIYLTKNSASRNKNKDLYSRMLKSIEVLQISKQKRNYSRAQQRMIDYALYSLISNAVYLALSITDVNIDDLKKTITENKIIPLSYRIGNNTAIKIMTLNFSFDLFVSLIGKKICSSSLKS